MTAPATIKTTEIKAIAMAMAEAGIPAWSVRIETKDGRKMVVNAGAPVADESDQFDNVVYPTK
jgi:hypothetical protein